MIRLPGSGSRLVRDLVFPGAGLMLVAVLLLCTLALYGARQDFHAGGQALAARLAIMNQGDDAHAAMFAGAAGMHPGTRIEWRDNAGTWHGIGADPSVMARPQVFAHDGLRLLLETGPLMQRQARILGWGLFAIIAIVAAAFTLSRKLEQQVVLPLRQWAHVTAGPGHEDNHFDNEIHALGEHIRNLHQQIAQHQLSAQEQALEASRYRIGACSVDMERARFLAVVGDRLRQPLQAMTLFTDSLERSARSLEQQQTVARMQQCADTMRELLDELSMHARLNADVVRVETAPVTISGLFGSLRRSTADTASALGVRIRWVGNDATVLADPQMLCCLLTHLVQNAIEAAPHGSVLVACRRRGGMLRIEVRDNGSGISRLHQARIFDDFFQLGDGSRRRERRLGLGLPICTRIASLLGSRIQLRSQLGRGSVFWLDLPAAHSAVADRAGPPCLDNMPIRRAAG